MESASIFSINDSLVGDIRLLRATLAGSKSIIVGLLPKIAHLVESGMTATASPSLRSRLVNWATKLLWEWPSGQMETPALKRVGISLRISDPP